MTLDPRRRNEIDRLLETLRDGELNAAETDYLESLLIENADLRRYYIQSVATQVGLRRLSAGPLCMEHVFPTDVPATQPSGPLVQGVTGASRPAASLSAPARAEVPARRE